MKNEGLNDIDESPRLFGLALRQMRTEFNHAMVRERTLEKKFNLPVTNSKQLIQRV